MKEGIFCQVVVVMMLLWSSQIQAQGCNDSGITLLMGCQDSIDKEIPTPPKPFDGCCTLVRLIGMKCLCELVDKQMEAIIDMQKVVKMAADCARPLVPGSQCGTYKVPGGMQH